MNQNSNIFFQRFLSKSFLSNIFIPPFHVSYAVFGTTMSWAMLPHSSFDTSFFFSESFRSPSSSTFAFSDFTFLPLLRSDYRQLLCTEPSMGLNFSCSFRMTAQWSSFPARPFLRTYSVNIFFRTCLSKPTVRYFGLFFCYSTTVIFLPFPFPLSPNILVSFVFGFFKCALRKFSFFHLLRPGFLQLLQIRS